MSAAMTAPEWPEDRISELTRLWMDGLSAGQIAARIGGTRSAIIGKVHRLKLQRGPHKAPVHGNRGVPKAVAVVARTEKRRAERARAEVKAETAPADNADVHVLRSKAWEPLPGRAAVALEDLDLRHECQWPIGDDPIKFCGVKRGEHHAYCDAHADIAEPMRGLIR